MSKLSKSVQGLNVLYPMPILIFKHFLQKRKIWSLDSIVNLMLMNNDSKIFISQLDFRCPTLSNIVAHIVEETPERDMGPFNQ